jgi:hypothetical protein
MLATLTPAEPAPTTTTLWWFVESGLQRDERSWEGGGKVGQPCDGGAGAEADRQQTQRAEDARRGGKQPGRGERTERGGRHGYHKLKEEEKKQGREGG